MSPSGGFPSSDVGKKSYMKSKQSQQSVAVIYKTSEY